MSSRLPVTELSAEGAARATSFVLPPPKRGGRLAGAVTWATAAALVVVWASAGWSAAGGDLVWPAVAAMSALPYLAVIGIGWTFLLWTLFPDRGLSPWLLGLATVAPLALWGPIWRQSPDDTSGVAVRLMTWNVRRLWGGPDDSGNARACLVREVLAANPDVLTLEELTAQDLDALTVDLGLSCAWDTYRARSTGPKRSGLAVCTRGAWRLDHGGAQPYVADDDWQRIDATVSRDDTTLRVVGVHLATLGVLDEPVNRLDQAVGRMPKVFDAQAQQGRALQALATAERGPLVIAGDFNGTRDTPVHVGLRGVLRDAWDVAGDGYGGTVSLLGLLPLRVDHVYVSPKVGIGGIRVPVNGCSDHRPVVTDLHIRP